MSIVACKRNEGNNLSVVFAFPMLAQYNSTTSMMYKALFLDVDGTTIPYIKDSLPSERVTEAIKKASEKIHVILATGRPYSMVTHLFEHLGMKGYAIINDGAQVIDITTGEILYEKQMLIKDALEATRIIKQFNTPFYIHDYGKDLLFTESYKPKKPFNIFLIDEYDETLVDTIISKLTHIPTLKVNKTHGAEKFHFIISHAEATKLHGIYEVSRMLGIKKEERIGVGDSGNDFQLLMACGLRIAMGNAIDDLKAIADYIAPPVEKDGVAHIINKFVLQIE